MRQISISRAAGCAHFAVYPDKAVLDRDFSPTILVRILDGQALTRKQDLELGCRKSRHQGNSPHWKPL